MAKKVTPSTNLWHIMSRAVEEGTQYGLTRAHKHDDDPSSETIREHIEREVMNALSEVIDFGN